MLMNIDRPDVPIVGIRCTYEDIDPQNPQQRETIVGYSSALILKPGFASTVKHGVKRNPDNVQFYDHRQDDWIPLDVIDMHPVDDIAILRSDGFDDKLLAFLGFKPSYSVETGNPPRINSRIYVWGYPGDVWTDPQGAKPERFEGRSERHGEVAFHYRMDREPPEGVSGGAVCWEGKVIGQPIRKLENQPTCIPIFISHVMDMLDEFTPNSLFDKLLHLREKFKRNETRDIATEMERKIRLIKTSPESELTPNIHKQVSAIELELTLREARRKREDSRRNRHFGPYLSF
jgi:hypothetical protein